MGNLNMLSWVDENGLKGPFSKIVTLFIIIVTNPISSAHSVQRVSTLVIWG